MKNKIAILILAIFLISSASAEILIGQQPKAVYNLGEVITIPITIKSLNEVSDVFEMNLICQGQELNFYKNGVSLSTGQEQKMDPSLVLTRKMLNNLKGDCLIKAILGTDYILTGNFKISDSINMNTDIKTLEINPGEDIIIIGTATKESGKEVNGFMQIEASSKFDNTKYIDQIESINIGAFTINVSTPANMRAGIYTVKLTAYERDSSGEITNQGTANNVISIKQVAQNLEIVIENQEALPGTIVKIKTLLHDQTGDNIPSNTTIKIKNNKDKLVEQIDMPTDEFFEYKIENDQAPGEFKVIGESNNLMHELSFNIKEKQDIQLQIINKTLLIKNTGNVPYCNKTVLIKIGGEVIEVPVCLDVNKEAKYTLTAPDGEYQVEIIADDKKISENVALTGSSINIREVSAGVAGLTRHPIIWVFVIGVMGFFAIAIFRKGFKRIFIGRIFKTKPKQTNAVNVSSPLKITAPTRDALIGVNKAQLSLSIKGENQDASMICLRVKNMRHVQENIDGIKETLEKIYQLVRDNKIMVYQSQENIFFILAPIKTRTFKNERVALMAARRIKEILTTHNKLFKQKIEYGISVTYGTIIAKQGPEALEFMPMGDVLTKAKRISLSSKEEVLLDEKIKERLGAEIKTEKSTHEKSQSYKVTDIKNTGEHDKFIKGFLERQK